MLTCSLGEPLLLLPPKVRFHLYSKNTSNFQSSHRFLRSLPWNHSTSSHSRYQLQNPVISRPPARSRNTVRLKAVLLEHSLLRPWTSDNDCRRRCDRKFGGSPWHGRPHPEEKVTGLITPNYVFLTSFLGWALLRLPSNMVPIWSRFFHLGRMIFMSKCRIRREQPFTLCRSGFSLCWASHFPCSTVEVCSIVCCSFYPLSFAETL